jgi:phage terminase large subunit
MMVIVSLCAEVSGMKIALTPKQKKLKNLIKYSSAETIAYGGARGGAKSRAARDLALTFGYEYGTQSLIFRKYRDDLLKNHVYPMLKERPLLRPYFNKSELILYGLDKNPIIKFDYAETDEEIEKVAQGPEYQLIFIDEASQITQYMIEYLTTPNRDSQGVLPNGAKMIILMNPGGISHAYLKRIFIDKIYRDNEDPKSYAFIQAHVWDNVFWCIRELYQHGFTINDYYYKWTNEQRKKFTIQYSKYAKRLSNLPTQLRDAYLFGDWNVFGSMFFQDLDLAKQIEDPFPIPTTWTLVGSLDPGYASPLSFGLQAISPKGTIHRIATYYAQDKIQNHAINIRKWIKEDSSPLSSILRGREPDYIVSGADAFQKLDKNALQSNELTVKDIFYQQGLILTPANTKPGSRISGWWKWKGLIPDRYKIFRGLNDDLINQMTVVETDEKYVEDIKGRGNDNNIVDHCLDEARYAIDAMSTPYMDEEMENLPGWYEEEFGDENQYDSKKITAMGI